MEERPTRNRRYSKKSGISPRAMKRLFTPEIKRHLKEWLVRRRENPYPNRDEKKLLAVETGLTYIQICNWFANWRRKLKNASDERKRTWGHLIKTYNTKARGNVEQFSICSDDSIWEEEADDRSRWIEKSKSPKSHIMDKYLSELEGRSELSRWLQSAAGFRTCRDERWSNSDRFDTKHYLVDAYAHGREEVEAAVALTRLAGAYGS